MLSHTSRIVTSNDRKVKVIAAETGHIYDTAFHDDWVHTVIYTTKFFISWSDDRQAAFLEIIPIIPLY